MLEASSEVASTGPTNEAPMRAALMIPMASPPAVWAMRATTIGNTGARHRT